MPIFRHSFLFLIATLLFSQKAYDLNSLVNKNGFFTEVEKSDPIDGKVFKMINNEKSQMGVLKKGRKHGRWIEWHPDERRLEENYKNGILDGKYEEYHTNGKIAIRGKYSSSNKKGEWLEFSKRGILKKRIKND